MTATIPKPFEVKALTAIMLFWAVVGVISHIILWPDPAVVAKVGPIYVSHSALAALTGKVFHIHLIWSWSAFLALVAAFRIWRLTGGRTLGLWIGWCGLFITVLEGLEAFPETGLVIEHTGGMLDQVPRAVMRVVAIPFAALLVWRIALLHSRRVRQLFCPVEVPPRLLQPERPAFVR